MMLLSRRSQLAVAAVVDVALHARPAPVSAKALAARQNLPPRYLETLLQALVRANVLKGIRGPRGGYELARERRRITAGEIVRAVMSEATEENGEPAPQSALVDRIIGPLIEEAGLGFLATLDAISVDELCQRAEAHDVGGQPASGADFTI